MTQPEQHSKQPNRLQRLGSFIVGKATAIANSEFVGTMADETARQLQAGRTDPLTGTIVPASSNHIAQPDVIAKAHAVSEMSQAMNQVSTVADMWNQDGTARR